MRLWSVVLRLSSILLHPTTAASYSLLPGAQQLAHCLCFSQQQTEVLCQQVHGGGQLIGIVNSSITKIKIGGCTKQKSESTQPRWPKKETPAENSTGASCILSADCVNHQLSTILPPVVVVKQRCYVGHVFAGQ